MTVFDNFFAYAQGKVFNTYGNESSSTVVTGYPELAGQCVSLIKAYLKYGGYGVKAYGDAIQYWTNRNNNGILNVCDVVSSPQNGDIVVSSGSDPRYGHIFIYCNGQAFTQNCYNNPKATLYPLSYQGTIYGYLRPKFMIQDQYNVSQLIAEHGLATFTYDQIVIRRDSPTGTDTGRRFNAGDVQEYTEKWVGNGHRYISWIENSVRYFAAVSNSETQGVETWATFSTVEDEPTNVDSNELMQEDGVATLTTDIGVNARKNGPNGEIVRTYQPGAQIRYYWKWVGNGHRYIVWKEGEDYIYLAVSGTEVQGEEPWATFAAPDEIEDPVEMPSPSTGDSEDEEDEDWDLEDPDLEPELYVPTPGWLEKFGIQFVVNLVPKDLYKYKCPYVMSPIGTGTHNAGTDGDPSAEQLNQSMINASTEQKSWHLSVDEATVVQGLPLNRNAWSFGDGKDGEGNRNYIAVEICRDMLASNDDKFTQAEKTAAIVIADLMYQHGWIKDTIKKHQDFADKYCPHKTLDKGWDRYVEMVLDYLDQLMQYTAGTDTPDVPEEPSTPEEGESVNGGLINTLVSLLIKLVNKLLNIFK